MLPVVLSSSGEIPEVFCVKFLCLWNGVDFTPASFRFWLSFFFLVEGGKCDFVSVWRNYDWRLNWNCYNCLPLETRHFDGLCAWYRMFILGFYLKKKPGTYYRTNGQKDDNDDREMESFRWLLMFEWNLFKQSVSPGVTVVTGKKFFS